jgi:acetylornithine deacetylase/succinyl-diaminopimelate desuccinylase-like protein
MSGHGIHGYIESNRERFISELRQVVQQPSISSQGVGMDECASLIEGMLEKRGFQTRLLSSGGYPAIYAERRGESRKAILCYGHYDVQPPDPLEEWASPPFAAEIRDGKIFGRGVSDHKGSLVSRLHAVDALLAVDGTLPLTVKFILEGEEESGSRTLSEIVRQHRDLLAADFALYAGGAKDENDSPVIRCGQKGMCYVQLTCTGASQDLHSRTAALVPSPVWRLVQALASLKDEQGRVTIPGFYDDVDPVSEQDMEALRTVPFNADRMKLNWGISRFVGGVEDVEALEQYLFTPTCNISGISAGYTGVGMKTVLPCRASAKLDLRLVPSQQPLDIVDKLRSHLEMGGFGDVEVDVLGTFEPARTPLTHPLVRSAVQASRRVYGQEPVVMPLWSGSGPRYLFSNYLGIPMIADPGVGHSDGRHHAPNESLRIDDYIQGIHLMAELLRELGRAS